MNAGNLRSSEAGSASVWAILITAGAFTLLLGLVVDGGRLIDARIDASHAAAQAARAGADALSGSSVRNGNASIDPSVAQTRAENYLHKAGLTGTVRVVGDTVTVTISDVSKTQILGVIGIKSLPVNESRTATAVTQGAGP